MTTATIPRSRNNPRTRWLVPAALIFLSLVPIIAGAVRLTDLTEGQITPDNARFFDSPIPVLIHIPAVTVYLLLGAFQFVPSLRRGKRGRTSWHKIAGRVLAPTGLRGRLFPRRRNPCVDAGAGSAGASLWRCSTGLVFDSTPKAVG